MNRKMTISVHVLVWQNIVSLKACGIGPPAINCNNDRHVFLIEISNITEFDVNM